MGSLKIKNKIELDSNSTEETEQQTPTSKQLFNVPWIEKYRPKTLDDIAVDEITEKKLDNMMKNREMQNIIITGVPGVGKTTTILCLARHLLGKYYKDGLLEMNASDDRGVKAVKDTIINFCKKTLIVDDEKYHHKIILLDEADNMTVKAQQLIKNIMEKYRDTKFAFTCNNSSDIIEAIQSRCIIFRYKRLTRGMIKNRLTVVCEKENVECTDSGLEALVTTADGDMRQAINNLQLTYNGYNRVTEDYVYKLCDRPHPTVIKEIFLSCKNKNINNAVRQMKDIKKNGYSSYDISLSMINVLKMSSFTEIDEYRKIQYTDILSKTVIIINKGVNSDIQLTACLASMCLIK